MRILVVSVRSPTPVVDGFDVQLAGLLTQLAREHCVHVVAHGRPVDIDGVTSTVVPPLVEPTRAARVAGAGLGVVRGEPASARRFRLGPLAAALPAVLAEHPFDVAHVTNADAAFASRLLGSMPRVLVPIDAWSLNQLELARSATGLHGLFQRATVRTVQRHERDALGRYDATVVVAEADRAALAALAPSARVEVIPNGVDTDHFRPDPSVVPSPGLVAFHGAMGYAPNVDAATFLVEGVLPRLQGIVPAARVRLVGRDPDPRVAALAGPSVEVTGTVVDVRRPLLEAEVAVLPLRRGTGIKNKLLEAAALGLPIVATGAALGDVDLVDGEHLFVREGAADLAEAIAVLLGDPVARARMGAAARAHVDRDWSWGRTATRFVDLYGEVVADRH